jgi:protein associated with RNAse G/E
VQFSCNVVISSRNGNKFSVLHSFQNMFVTCVTEGTYYVISCSSDVPLNTFLELKQFLEYGVGIDICHKHKNKLLVIMEYILHSVVLFY